MSRRIISQNYPLKLLREALGMGQNTSQQPKIYQFSPPKKSSLINLDLPLSKPSFLFHQIAIFISSLYTSFICSCSHCCCMLILINQCLLNVVKFIPSNISIIPTFRCYLENSASLNAYLPLFHTPFFISNLIKFQLTPLQFGLCGLCANQIIMDCGNKSDETPYLIP